MITQYTTLNMVPGSKPQVSVSQYDTGARVLVFRLKTGYTPFTPPEGCTAIIHGIKPDSTYFSYAAEIDGDTVIADCTEQMTAVTGFAECEIRITNTEGRVGSCNFRLAVEKSPETGAIISESDIPVFEQLATRAETAAASATASASAASESAEQAGESATTAGESADRAAREAETASQAAEEAGESAVSAANSASSASGSETSARGFAEQAEQSANEASESAQGAEQDAQTASAKASEAAQSAELASGEAGLAEGYARDARLSAQSAQQNAQAAEDSATNAAGSASTASQAAETATTKAGEASQSASAAGILANSAASSASAASTSAETASEKAAQAGESATNAANFASAAEGSASDASDSADSAAASARAADQSASDIAASAAQIQTNTDSIAALQIVESTSAADITSIDDGADGVPMKSLKVYIKPVQSGSGDPSPDNIRPISGWDSVETVRTGVNLWDEEWEIGIINPDGTIGASTTRIVSKNFIPVVGGTEYSVSYPAITNVVGRGAFYDADENLVQYCGEFPESYTTANGRTYGTVTAPENAKYLKFGPSVQYGTTYNNSLSINYPSTDHDYHPYHGTTYPTDLPVTVYGGTLDVISGVLTVDMVLKVFDGSESFITNTAWGNYAKLYDSGIRMLSSFSTSATISSHFKRSTGGGWNLLIANYFMIAGNTFIGLGWDGSVAELKTFLTEQYMAGTPVQVAGFLATPTTYTLTPEEVKTLLKVNNIFADAGQTAIVYVADPKTYIDSAIADAVASLT